MNPARFASDLHQLTSANRSFSSMRFVGYHSISAHRTVDFIALLLARQVRIQGYDCDVEQSLGKPGTGIHRALHAADGLSVDSTVAGHRNDDRGLGLLIDAVSDCCALFLQAGDDFHPKFFLLQTI